MKISNGYSVTEGSQLAAGERNDCVVRAIANATGAAYDDVHPLVAKHLKRRPRQGTFTHQHRKGLIDIAAALGFTVEYALLPSVAKIDDVLPNAERAVRVFNDLRGARVNLTIQGARRMKGRFMVVVRSHAMAIVDGEVFDNGDRTSGKHRIKWAVRFVPVSEPSVQPEPVDPRGATFVEPFKPVEEPKVIEQPKPVEEPKQEPSIHATFTMNGVEVEFAVDVIHNEQWGFTTLAAKSTDGRILVTQQINQREFMRRDVYDMRGVLKHAFYSMMRDAEMKSTQAVVNGWNVHYMV